MDRASFSHFQALEPRHFTYRTYCTLGCAPLPHRNQEAKQASTPLSPLPPRSLPPGSTTKPHLAGSTQLTHPKNSTHHTSHIGHHISLSYYTLQHNSTVHSFLYRTYSNSRQRSLHCAAFPLFLLSLPTQPNPGARLRSSPPPPPAPLPPLPTGETPLRSRRLKSLRQHPRSSCQSLQPVPFQSTQTKFSQFLASNSKLPTQTISHILSFFSAIPPYSRIILSSHQRSRSRVPA